jgi:hypothetical protein
MNATLFNLSSLNEQVIDIPQICSNISREAFIFMLFFFIISLVFTRIFKNLHKYDERSRTILQIVLYVWMIVLGVLSLIFLHIGLKN